MWRNHLCAVIGSLSCSVGVATAADRPKNYDEMIARQAEIHGVPEALVHGAQLSILGVYVGLRSWAHGLYGPE